MFGREGHEKQVHLRRKPPALVPRRGDPPRKRDQFIRTRARAVRVEKVAKLDRLAVHGGPGRGQDVGWEGHQRCLCGRRRLVVAVAVLGFGEENAGFLKGFADGGEPVRERVPVVLGVVGRQGAGREVGFVEGRDVPAREDVCGREAVGCLDAVEEEHFVGWREEDHACAGCCVSPLCVHTLVRSKGRRECKCYLELGNGLAGGALALRRALLAAAPLLDEAGRRASLRGPVMAESWLERCLLVGEMQLREARWPSETAERAR